MWPYEALLIPPSGPLEFVEVHDIAQKRELLDCRTFDCIAVRRIIDDRPITFDVWVDDEFLLHNEAPAINPRASLIAGQALAGIVMVTDGPDHDGNTRSITDLQVEFCRTVDAMVNTAQSPVVESTMRVATLSQED